MTKSKRKFRVGEELKIAVTLTLKNFMQAADKKELEFPSSLLIEERAFVHVLSLKMGLKSKSRGKGPNRFLTVYKKDGSTIIQADATFGLGEASRHHVVTLLQRFPVTNRERQDLVPLYDRERPPGSSGGGGEGVRDMNRTTGRLNNGIPQIPPARGSSEYLAFRETLPVWSMRDELVSVIENHQVVLIAGETGSGKTTQIPQFILDSCYVKRKPVRIISTQPRRISALTVAERVASERDEKIGLAVGYQIRLESRVSPKTLLTFCTNGVLLRTLMGGDAALATVTHIIVDEIHERDRYSDFLLIILRDALAKFRNLKLVLMSAAVDVQLFQKYFNGCPVLMIPGKMYDVQEMFLEDVLKCTGYTSAAMLRYKKEGHKKQKQTEKLIEWCSKFASSPLSEKPNHGGDEAGQSSAAAVASADEAILETDSKLVSEMDKHISEAWLHGTEEAFSSILYLVMNENVSIDHRHSETGVTPLMVAAGRGFPLTVEQLLNLGANVDVRASNNWTARDWARNFNQKDIVEILDAHIAACESVYSDMSDLLSKSKGQDIGEEEKNLLEIYHHSFDDEKVDLDLILCLLHKIMTSGQEGAVLVFLPGYDEIVRLREKIAGGEDKRFADSSRYVLFTLHSSMHSFDQRNVFRPAPRNVRKIILSTNIAETSVTFNDVVFVVDSGKVKEKFFDAVAGISSLKSVWISRASCVQRKGRAGRCRPGICYRLFSRIRYSYMQDFQQAEILRVPLQDLCLHTKLLAPPNTPIADFLARAPEAPPFLVTRNAVLLLKTIDALDPWEQLSELGHHLVDLPIDPRLGKMVLYAVILKCLDPILTVACALAYRDPFLLPTMASEKKLAAVTRKKFSALTFSDHMSLLRAFQAWQKAGSDGWEKIFCQKNFLSSSAMEMIVGMRTQLLGQLRASGFVRARGGGDIRDLNTNSENWAVVKAALVAGSYPNLIRIDRERMQLVSQKESKVWLHPSCVFAEMPQSAKMTVAGAHSKIIDTLPSDWLIYEEMSRTEHIAYARCCTLVSPITVALFAGPSRLPLDAISESGVHGGAYDEDNSESENEEGDEGQTAMLKLDDWASFKVDSEAAHLALQLRQKWHSLFLRRIKAPAKPWSQIDEAVLRTIINVISCEESELGLQQPCGIGQRPRPVSTDYLACAPVGVRHSFQDGENHPDDASADGVLAHFAPRIQRKMPVASPKNKETGGQKCSDERSDSSSVRSTSSACGSSPISPCHSPTLSGSPSDKDAASPHPNRYFVIKGNSQKSIEVSLTKSIWMFSILTEKRLQKCLQEGKVVYLVFSVQGSGHFQGYARLTSEIVQEKIPEFSLPNLGHAYKIQWVKRANIPFQSTRHLQNPWNECRKVQISRDGQELEPTVGEALCKLWDKVPTFVPKSSFVVGGGHSRSTDETANKVEYDRQQQGFRHQFQIQHQQHFVGRPIRGYQHHGAAGASANAFGGAVGRTGSQQGPSGIHASAWNNHQVQQGHNPAK